MTPDGLKLELLILILQLRYLFSIFDGLKVGCNLDLFNEEGITCAMKKLHSININFQK